MRRFTISLFITILSLGLLLTPSSALERESFYQRYHVSPEGLVVYLNQTDARSYGDSQNWYNLTGLDHFEQATGANQPTITGALNLAGSCRDADGDDYMHQKIYDTNQGNMTFVADGGTAEFRDDGQDFSDWETATGNAAYMLVVTTNNGVSWGYMGEANNSDQDIDIYSDIALTTRGWKARTTPQATPDTPASYEVLNTINQITGDLSVFIWIKPDDGQPAAAQGIISPTGYDSGATQRSSGLFLDTDGKIHSVASDDGTPNGKKTSSAVFANGAQSSFTNIGSVYDASESTILIYINGISVAVENKIGGGPSASILDTYVSMTIGSFYNNGSPAIYFAGLIGPDIQIFERALSAAEVQRIFNEDRKAFGL